MHNILLLSEAPHLEHPCGNSSIAQFIYHFSIKLISRKALFSSLLIVEFITFLHNYIVAFIGISYNI